MKKFKKAYNNKKLLNCSLKKLRYHKVLPNKDNRIKFKKIKIKRISMDKTTAKIYAKPI
jgi:hypothetical protein